jgi:hypothetical protein
MTCLRVRNLVTAACTLLVLGCASGPPPEERTDDGLVRVPSRAAGGVYRNPDIEFTGYRRVSVEPLSIEYATGWQRQHPEVTEGGRKRIETEARKIFNEEFVKVLVGEGPYELAETRDPDVLLVVPRVIDLDIPAPEPDLQSGTKTYSPHPVRMQIVGELRDAVTNTLVLRVIMFEGQERYPFDELRPANRVTNASEMRTGFNRWSRLVREALDVAKVRRPKPEKAD